MMETTVVLWRGRAVKLLQIEPTIEMNSVFSSQATDDLGLDRLVLTGFMGSGKSTVGHLLAERLHWSFLDLDHEIERREGRSIPRLFAEEGEAYFRRAESLALVSALGRHRTVLALGGGAPEALGNKLLLEQTPRTAIVHLTAPFKILIERCLQQDGPGARPVLANLEKAAERFDLRHRIYTQLADHTVETSELEAAEIVDVLLAALAR